MADPLVHVLIINWNGLAHLEACFESLVASSYENARFVLLDNGSTDDSVAFVRSRFGNDPRVEILTLGENLGWSGGNNAGLERALAAGADYVFLLNNDTAVGDGILETLVRMAEADPTLGALAPKMVLFDQPGIINSVGLVCSRIGNGWDKGVGRADVARWNRPEEIIGVCGGAMFVRAAALRRTGLLPSDFEIYLDDLDLSLRIWDAGYRICSCPEAVVRHKFSATYGRGKGARRKYFLNTRNRFRLVARNFPRHALATTLALTIVGEVRALGRALLGRELWRIWAHLRAWLSALASLPQDVGHRWRMPGRCLGRYWPLIHRERLFCPLIELPDRGWYAVRKVSVSGRPLELQPVSGCAWHNCAPGLLRVQMANCYPHLGTSIITVLQDGRELDQLSTASYLERWIPVQGGRIEFRSDRLYYLEDTGLPMDVGGWLRLDATRSAERPAGQ